MNNNYSKKTILTLFILTIIFTVIGGSLAYYNWETSTSQRTNVVFTATSDFSCSADGGGDITSDDVQLVPTSCTNSEYAIKRKVTVSPSITSSDKTIMMNLWLKVNTMGTGLSESVNFNYVLTRGASSCTDNVVTSGNFNGTGEGNKVYLFEEKSYSSTTEDTYYLWIWLDNAETSTSTMNQEFSLSLGGMCTDDNSPKPNAPVLDNTGMIPVTIANNGKVTTVSSNDSSWYNYSNQRWANAVLVKETGDNSRSYYLNNTGVEVDQDDILAYYVWIPRYGYAFPDETMCSQIDGVNATDYPGCYKMVLTNGDDDKDDLIDWWYDYAVSNGMTSYTKDEATADVEAGLETGVFENDLLGSMPTTELIVGYNQLTGSNMSYTQELVSDNKINNPRTINVRFEGASDSLSSGDATGTSYKTHPAFVFGGETLPGIWVGKFETTQGTTLNVGTSNPTILPNTSSWRSQNVSTQFKTSLLFSGGSLATDGTVSFASSTTYGLASTTDSHMMKNSEWGAVAYLSHSRYGINEEIRINNNNSYTTGCGASEANANSTSACSIAYGQATSYPQSTTGNITGIFDMSGGAWEYVMGVLADDNGEPRSGYSSSLNSGFNGALSSGTYESGIEFPDDKYYDLYTSAGGNYGHALEETANWYSDYAFFVSAVYPWFVRGGGYGTGADAGAFLSGNGNGNAYGYLSWSSVLVV